MFILKVQVIMSISKDDAFFDHLYHCLYTHRQVNKAFKCYVLSGVLCSFFLKHFSTVFIIDAEDHHSVVYDGKNTWDISLGIVFNNYKYPLNNVPKPDIIPAFAEFYDLDIFNKYYSKESLSFAQKQRITVKKMQKHEIQS